MRVWITPAFIAIVIVGLPTAQAATEPVSALIDQVVDKLPMFCAEHQGVYAGTNCPARGHSVDIGPFSAGWNPAEFLDVESLVTDDLFLGLRD